MKKYLLLCLPFLFLTLSCEKEADAPDNPLFGSWQKTKVESKVTNGNWTVKNQPCQLDDIEEYRPNGAWTLFSGSDQCSPGNGIMRGTWKQEAAASKLVYTYEGYSGEYESTIESLTSEAMVLVNSTGALNGEQIRTSYKKQ